MKNLIAPILYCFVFLSITACAQTVNSTYPDGFNDPFPIYEKALGDFTHPISSGDETVQTYFDQGFQMMYAFTTEDAARSFREAWKLDPECAICYWGEAWAWGSYLNGRMKAEDSPRAYAAIQKAIELADAGFASEKEKAFINTMAVRYAVDYVEEEQKKRDSLYAVASGRLYEKYPNDLDAGTLYGEALFLLEPRRGYRDIIDEDVIKIHQVLESVLAKDIKHPGACHLYIHATESTTQPEKAEACAEFIGTSIPGASHINHMPSHTWNEMGRWGDAVTANIMAWHSDQKEAVGEGFAIYPSHNLHMLVFAGAMDGQGGVSNQAARDYTKLTGNNMYELQSLIRFGRFGEVFRIQERSSYDVAAGMFDFAWGYALAKEGEIDSATFYLNRLSDLADSTESKFRFHSGALLLGTVSGILKGELSWLEGDTTSAIDAFETAVELEDQLDYDEPEPLIFAARHWLGALYLDIKEFKKAEEVYRMELEDHPNNGWSYYGLLQALEGQGIEDAELKAKFAASWARSDTWIRGSRF